MGQKGQSYYGQRGEFCLAKRVKVEWLFHMEIVCIDKQTFDELRVRFGKLEEKVMGMCRPVEDLGLKKWLDNQEVCEILRISKKTLQVYRDKGILPYSRIKHKIFFKTEDVHKLLESNYYHLKREL